MSYMSAKHKVSISKQYLRKTGPQLNRFDHIDQSKTISANIVLMAFQLGKNPPKEQKLSNQLVKCGKFSAGQSFHLFVCLFVCHVHFK